MGDWFDDVPGAYMRNVGRILDGVQLDIGDNERGIEERTVTVARVVKTIVGFDSAGLFTGVVVIDDDGQQWTLYSDGTIDDANDETVGRHFVKSEPQKAAV